MDTRKFLDNKYVKANVNVKQGDLLRFKDEGHEIADRNDLTKMNFEITVEVIRGGEILAEKIFGINKTNLNAIAALYGYGSTKWVGKEVLVNIVKRNNPSGQLVDAVAVSAPIVEEPEEEGDPEV